MQGTFDLEFIGDFFDQLQVLTKITVFRQLRKSADFIPIDFNGSAQNHRSELLRTLPARRVPFGLN